MGARLRAAGSVPARIVAVIAALAFFSTPTLSSNLTISGTVMSGSTVPVGASSVTLFQAGSGPGIGASALGSSSADSGADFSISPASTPPPGAVLYLVASGGNAGGGANSAIELMAIIGSVNASTSVTINELTTIAAAYSAANFITHETDIADNAFHALAGAAAAVGNLVNIQTGALGGIVANGNNDATIAELNTLANGVAECVRASSSSPACANLFAATDVPTTPADTLSAIINLTRSPVFNPSGIFGLGASGTIYSPPLGAAPTDWTVALNISGGGLNAPDAIAIDGGGNVWVANSSVNNSSVTELSAAGAPISSPPASLTLAA